MGNRESLPTNSSAQGRAKTETKVGAPSASNSNFFTGVDVEEQSFTWTIGNFNAIRMHQALIDSQKIDFTVCDTKGQQTKWTACLRDLQAQRNPRPARRWIGVAVSLWGLNPTKYRTQFLFNIKNTKGEVINEAETGLMFNADKDTYYGNSHGFTLNFIDADQDDLCPWGALMINVTVKMYTPFQPQSLGSVEAVEVIQHKFQAMFLEQFQKDFVNVLKSPDASADIKIVASDGKEFTIQRGILAVRSNVFAAMLNCDMIEATSGVINLPDISSNALKVLLSLLGTGKLLPEWSNPGVILELTNAAAKYQLEGLLQFLNLTLGKICNSDNAIPRLILARQLNLKVAEDELIKFLRKDLMDSDERFMQMLNTLTDESDESDESDEPEKKRQKLN